MKATVTTKFTATWSNYGVPTQERTFEVGESYYVQSSRPEGISIDGFFVFEKHFPNLKLES